SRSRSATYCISSVITPRRAKCICDILGFPFVAAASASRFSIQSARTVMQYPQDEQQRLANWNYGTQLPERRLDICEHLQRLQSDGCRALAGTTRQINRKNGHPQNNKGAKAVKLLRPLLINP